MKRYLYATLLTCGLGQVALAEPLPPPPDYAPPRLHWFWDTYIREAVIRQRIVFPSLPKATSC